MSTLIARKKMGRPRVESEEIRSRVQQPLLGDLDAWAEAHGIPRAEAARRLIDLGLAAYEYAQASSEIDRDRASSKLLEKVGQSRAGS